MLRSYCLINICALFNEFLGLRNEEYDRILQAAADEEAYLRKLQNDELRKSWEESIKHKKDTSEPEIDTTPAAQNIGVEDRLRPERIKAQKEQMKRWAEEQAAANARSRAREKDEDNAYADMIRAVDEIRGKADAEEAALRKKLQHDLAKENLEVCYIFVSGCNYCFFMLFSSIACRIATTKETCRARPFHGRRRHE